MAHAMPKIYLSSRRGDGDAISERLYDLLSRQFGRNNVTVDTEPVPPGVDFRAYLAYRLQDSDTVLAVIGPQWLTVEDAAGNRRLDNRDDPVRTEIEMALQLSIRVIPILINGATMPRRNDLPPSLSNLASLQALVIHDGLTFDNDVRLLAVT